MSKYTKALEKIQRDREVSRETLEKKRSAERLKLEAAAPAARWDRGVATIRNSDPDKRIVTYHFPDSLLAEQYRMLRINLKTQLSKDQSKVILISSSIHGEGKTVTAANLAISLAEMPNTKVALVDADIRRGKLAEYLGLGKNLSGLSDFLSSDSNAKQFMVRNSIDNLMVMPRGKLVRNPSNLLTSEKLEFLIAELRSHFDYVVVDSPPIMSTADAGMLGRMVDGLVMVIQSGRTPKTVIAQSHILFRQAGIRTFGYILTNVEFQSSDYRYYYYQYDHYADGADAGRRITGFKNRLQHNLKRAGIVFEKYEQQFNQWWEEKCASRKNGEKKTEAEKTKAEAGPDAPQTGGQV